MSALDRILNARSLPTLPTVAVRLLELSRDPSAASKLFVETVHSDPAISAKLLKLSNSSYLGIRSNVTTVQRAVTLLGTRSVTSLALGFSIARQSSGSGELPAAFDAYWQRSVLQAVACETQDDEIPEHSGSELFLAGLMLDIGQLAMLRVLGRPYADVLTGRPAEGESLVDVERREFGFDHAEAGAALLDLWKFPPMLVEATRRHHEADADVVARVRGEDAEMGALLAAARVASAAGDYFFGHDAGRGLASIQTACREERGRDEARTLDFCEDVAERFRENAGVFEADADTLPEPSELMAAANEQLAQAAIEAERSLHQTELARAKTEEANQSLKETRDSLESENEALRQQTVVDDLTGCFNRGFFNEAHGQEVDQCRRTARPVGTLFLDVDNFKKLNDTYGHAFGDEVLVEVARRLKSGLRDSDVLCRYGGEEFVVLAKQPTESGLYAMAERLRQAVESAVFQFGSQVVPVTVSVGAVHAVPELDEDDAAEEMIREADSAMYEAKNGGRNRVVLNSMLSPAEKELRNLSDERRFSNWLTRNSSLTAEQVAEALARVRPPGTRLGEAAVDYGLMTAEQVASVLERQNLGGRRQRAGQIAVSIGLLSQDDLATLLGVQQEDASDIARSVADLGYETPDRLAGYVESYRGEMTAKRPLVADAVG